MTSPGELLLKQKYRNMLGLENLDNISDINKVFAISQITNLQTTLDSKLNNTNSILQNNLTINNTLFVSYTSVLQGTCSILSDLKVSGNSSFLSNLNVSGIANINNLRTFNIISNNDLNSTINMFANYINIGTANSIINIQGTTNYVNITEPKYYDKLIHVNVSSTSSAIDNGFLAGITIDGNSGDGYIKTNTTATRFLIKPPLVVNDAYIATTDLNNNFTVSGTTILNSTTINSNLLINNDTTLLSNLYVSNNSILNNILSINNLNISSNTILNGILTQNSTLFVLGNTILNNNLNVSGNTILNNNLNVSGNTVLNNNLSTLSNVYISGTTILQGISTLLSVLSVSGNTNIYSNLLVNNTSIFNNNVSILSNLNVSGNTIIQGNTNINYNLLVSGNTIFQGNTTFITNVSILGSANLVSLNVNNVSITNNSILYGNVTICSQLFVTNNSFMNGITNLANLNVSGNTLINGSTSLLSNLNISGNTILNNTSILSNLNISGNTLINNNTTLLSNLNVSGNTILNNVTLSILNISGNAIINNDTTLLTNLYISGKTILNNDTTIMSNLNVSNNSKLYNLTTIGNNNLSNLLVSSNTTLLSKLNVSGNSLLNNVSILSNLNISGESILNNVSILSNLNISGKTILNNVSILSNLNISGESIFKNIIRGTNFKPISDDFTDINNADQTISIIGHVINIGNSNSHINILGTTTYVATSELAIKDKNISLNLNNQLEATDIGMNSGIDILGISGNGYIKTTSDATRYIIKAPMDENINYIATLDNNNNLAVSGNSLLNDVSILSNLNISGNSLLNNTTIYSNLYVSGVSLFNNNVNLNNNLYISGQCNLWSDLIISGNSLLNNSTITSNLNVSGYSLLNNGIISNLIVSSSSLLNNVSIYSNLYVSNTSYFEKLIVSGQSLLYDTTISGYTLLNDTIINTTLNVSGQSLLNNTSINSILNVSGTSYLNDVNITGTCLLKNITIQSNLFVSNTSLLNQTFINSDLNLTAHKLITNQSNLQSITSLSSLLVLNNLANFTNDINAKLGGIPQWGVYRTGSIIKIRSLPENPTVNFILSGSSSINIEIGSYYNEPGVLAYDYDNNLLTPYLTSISNTTTSNIISNNINISGTTSITQTSSLTIGTYTISYSATDNLGTIETISRELQIYAHNIPIYNMSSGTLSYYNPNGLGQLTNSDWTIEFWVRLNSLKPASYNTFLYLENPQSNFYSSYLDIKHEYSTILNSVSNIITLTDTWYHIAFVKSNTTETIFVNGTSYSTQNTLPSSETSSNITSIRIGDSSSSFDSNTHLDGYISQLGIYKYVKYTNNFTPSVILKPQSMTNVLFFLDDNYNDIANNITLNQYPTNSVSKTILANFTDPIIEPFKPYTNINMIQYTNRQSYNYSVPPEIFTLNNINYWRWSSITSPVVLNPNVGNGFGGSGQSWSFSSSFLSNIGFSFTNSWCFVIRGIRNIYPESFLNLLFDTKSTWTNSNSGQNDGPVGIAYYSTSTNIILASNYNILTSYTSDSFLNSEFYMVLSYDISTKNIKAEIMDLLGNMKSAIVINNYTYVNNIKPFHIYNNQDTYTFNRGVVFSTTYMNYNTFSQYFS